MAKSQAVGHCECPECGFPDAEIKLTKGGLAYRWCPDCNSQYFTRNKENSDRLLGKLPKPKDEQETPAPSNETMPKKTGFDMGAL